MRRTSTSRLAAPLLALAVLAAPLAVAPAVRASVGPVPLPAAAAPHSTVADTGPAQGTRSTPARAAARPTAAARPAALPAARPRTVAPASRTGAYAFLQLDAGRPVRWNPCDEVPWSFNPAGAPAGGLAAVQAAVQEIGVRSGLRFAYQGTTSDAPTGAYLRQGWKQFRPLLVGWTSSSQSDLLAGRGASTVGVARVLWTGSFDSTGANRTQMASGVVALNRASKAGTTGPASWYTYALHEVGHAVGLDHVADGNQIMNPVISGSLRGFGSGDVAGLARIGAGGGCLPDIR